MLNLLPLCSLLLLAAATAASAQSFTIEVSPPEQTVEIGGAEAYYSITAFPSGGFGASVFLRVIAPTLNPATITLDRETINSPYTAPATLVIEPVGGDAGTHTIIVEGKNGGVVRYDTVRLTVTSDPNVDRWTIYHTGNSGLQSMTISAIDFDRTGAAWIGTYKGILRALPGEAPQRMPGPFESSRIEAIGVDSGGGVWVAGNSNENGVTRYIDGAWFTHTAPQDVSNGSVLSIAAAPGGIVWFGGLNGLFRRSGDTWTEFDSDDWGGAIGSRIRNMAVTPEGDLWAVTDRSSIETKSGLLKFDGTFWTGFSLDELGIASGSSGVLAVDDSSRVWVAGVDGTSIANPSGPAVIHHLTPFEVGYIAAQADGRLWIMNSAGPRLAVEMGGSWKEIDVTNSGLPSNARVEAFAVHDDGSVWIGTNGHGLAVLRPGNGTVSVPSPERPASADAFLVLSDPLALRLVTRGGAGRILLHNSVGEQVAVLFDGTMQPGEMTLPLDLPTISNGAYIVTVTIEGKVPSSRMITIVR